MEIGEKIKQRREELGWSQQTLAEKMGYTSKSAITRIEKGYNDVSQKHIVKFAKVLDVSIAYLMDWDNEDKQKAKSEELLKIFGRLTQESQAQLLKIAKTYLPDE